MRTRLGISLLVLLIAGVAGSASAAGSATAVESAVSSTQVVYLDFVTNGATSPLGSFTYTGADMAAIKAGMEFDYAAFDYSFTLTAPGAGSYSTIIFNEPTLTGGGGLASEIDFRNLNKDDFAVVNVEPLLGGAGEPPLTPATIVEASATIGAHELGHLAGLRHGDSYGPIGAGVNVIPGLGGYFPTYPGPATAVETHFHLMASPAAVGSSLADLVADSFFSERAAVKLAFNEFGTVDAEVGVPHGTIGTAQAMMLDPIPVPNTILAGSNVGKVFGVDALTVTGDIGLPGEVDFYSFDALGGEVFEMEVIALAMASVIDPGPPPMSIPNPRIPDPLDDPLIEVYDGTGTLIPYYASSATNDDEFETFDSILIDLIIPADGTYFVKVGASPFAAAATGDYELFLYSFAAAAAVPEPGAGLLFLTGALLAARAGRRRA